MAGPQKILFPVPAAAKSMGGRRQELWTVSSEGSTEIRGQAFLAASLFSPPRQTDSQEGTESFSSFMSPPKGTTVFPTMSQLEMHSAARNNTYMGKIY